MAQLTTEIDYTNFKEAVGERRDQENKHSAYLSVWSAMLRVQHDEDHEHKPNHEPYFKGWDAAWDRELERVSERFDYPDPVPTKTIRSVLDKK